MFPQPHKQLGPLDPLDDFAFQPRAGHRRLPHPWTHRPPPTTSPGRTPVPLEAATYPIQIPVRLPSGSAHQEQLSLAPILATANPTPTLRLGGMGVSRTRTGAVARPTRARPPPGCRLVAAPASRCGASSG